MTIALVNKVQLNNQSLAMALMTPLSSANIYGTQSLDMKPMNNEFKRRAFCALGCRGLFFH